MVERASVMEVGVEGASQAGESLGNVLMAAGIAQQQTEQSSQIGNEIVALTREMMISVEAVSMVVADNTEATRLMTSSIGQVSETMEKNARICQDNNTAVQQYNLSIKGINRQFEQVSTSAKMLSNVAGDLKSSVFKFKME